MPRKTANPDVRSLLIGHVLITDHLQNLHRRHGDPVTTDVNPVCGCGALLGRVIAGEKCTGSIDDSHLACDHDRAEHLAAQLGGCQHQVVQVRTVAEKDELGAPTGKTLDVVERSVCGCKEFRSIPSSIPTRADMIDAWLKHAGLPDNPTRDHLLLRIVGTYVPADSGPAAPSVAHCLCGEHLIAEGEDVTDPAAAIAAWAEHVQEAADRG